MDPGDEEFLRRLERQFQAARWGDIYKEMEGVFRRYLSDLAYDRMTELYNAKIAGLPHDSTKDEAMVALSSAYSQAIGEGVLVAVAHYFALVENPDAPGN